MKDQPSELIPYNHYKGIESIISGRELTNAVEEDDANARSQDPVRATRNAGKHKKK